MAKKTRRKPKKQHKFDLKAMFAGLFSREKLGLYLFLGKLTIIIVVAFGTIWGFQFMEKYVNQIAHERQVELEVVLKDRHERWEWASNELVRDILLAADVKSDDFLLDKDLVHKWTINLQNHSWIERVNSVQKRYDGKVIVDCDLRRPIAKIKQDSKVYYVDAEGHIMAPVLGDLDGRSMQVNPVYDHLVEIRGGMKKLPAPGTSLVADDVKAGLDIISMIRMVDSHQTDRNLRVLKELAVCDVSNFKDRKDRSQPRITFYTQRNTEIRWGAEVGNEISEFEPPAETKLSRLYLTYSKYQTLDTFMHVELRNHRNDKSDPLRDQG